MGWPGGSSASRCQLESWVTCAADFSRELSWSLNHMDGSLHCLGPSLLLHTLSQELSSFSTPAQTSFHGKLVFLNESNSRNSGLILLLVKKWPILGDRRTACMYRAGKDSGDFTAHPILPRPGEVSGSHIHLYSPRMGTPKKAQPLCLAVDLVI